MQDNGFAMLTKLIQSLHPNTIKQKLLAISDLAALEFAAIDTTASYMAKVSGLANSLCGITVDSFLAFLALSHFDPDLYPGIRASFLQADPSLLSLDLHGIKALHLTKSVMQLPPITLPSLLLPPLTMTINIHQKVLSSTNKSRMQLKLATALGASTPTIQCV
jgi:hypothetical protein